MSLVMSIILVSGISFVVIAGVRDVIASLLAMDTNRPPSLSDKYFQEELETED